MLEIVNFGGGRREGRKFFGGKAVVMGVTWNDNDGKNNGVLKLDKFQTTDRRYFWKPRLASQSDALPFDFEITKCKRNPGSAALFANKLVLILSQTVHHPKDSSTGRSSYKTR